MPRNRVVTTTIYKFNELSEDAQNKAIEHWGNLRSENFGSFDQEAIEDAMTYAFLQAIGSTSEDKLPAGVTFREWDVSYRTNLELSGELTPDNAPDLPWPDDIDGITLSKDYQDYGLNPFAAFTSNYYARDEEETPGVDALTDAAQQAVQEALSAGIREYEYIFSREQLQEDIEANDIEFLEDGRRA